MTSRDGVHIKPEPTDDSDAKLTKDALWGAFGSINKKKRDGSSSKLMKREKREQSEEGEAEEDEPDTSRYARQKRTKRVKTEEELEGTERRKYDRKLIEEKQHANDVKMQRGEVVNLIVMRDEIEEELRLFRRREPDLDPRKLRNLIQRAAFALINSVHRSKLLNPLSHLINEGKDYGVPEDIILDAEAIRSRIVDGNYDYDPYRGIVKTMTWVPVLRKSNGQPTGQKKKTTSQSLDKDYKFKRDANEPGERHLVVGQCWPLQICTVRDGAHGDMEAGISGNSRTGALSVIISGGANSKDPTKGYEDVDNLNEVLYCGTRGERAPKDPSNPEPLPGIPSDRTKLLLKAKELGTGIRLLRSSKAKSQYAPLEGIRYDGLYAVQDHEVLDFEHAMYRFRLVRLPGQYPVRWSGDHIKPDPVERERWGAERDKWAGDQGL